MSFPVCTMGQATAAGGGPVQSQFPTRVTVDGLPMLTLPATVETANGVQSVVGGSTALTIDGRQVIVQGLSFASDGAAIVGGNPRVVVQS